MSQQLWDVRGLSTPFCIRILAFVFPLVVMKQNNREIEARPTSHRAFCSTMRLVYKKADSTLLDILFFFSVATLEPNNSKLILIVHWVCLLCCASAL